MEARSHRNINNGKQYDHLFPAAILKDETAKKGATVSDTVRFIPKVVGKTLSQTKQIAKKLSGYNLSQTCRNIWDFVYHHIRYEKDEEGKEQIRSPARTWHDRFRGVDCDCYTVFISSILTNLKIPHRLRIARYKKDHFQHIYPIVPTADGSLPAGASAKAGYITIDCVVDNYNYEEPYTEIKDTTMDLEYLSGTDDDYSDEEMGRLFNRKKPAGGKSSIRQFIQTKKDGIKKVIADTKKGGIKSFVKTAAHIANRANPATLLLRNGVLICMKLNLMKVAQRLKYAYLSDAEAQKRGVDMSRFQKLKQVMQKLEQIFYGAGGKTENLKKAILTGRGNRNKAVSGLGYTDVGESDYSINESTPLPQLLGEDIYNSEMEGLGEAALGEPVSAAASITAATGAIGSIALLLKSIGSLFPKRAKESEDFENTETASEDLPAEIEENKEEIARMQLPDTPEENKGKNPADDNSGKNPSEEEDSQEENKGKNPSEGFWDKNKGWLKPTLIGATGLGLFYLGYRAITGKKEEQKAPALSGTKGKKHHKHKKKEVELM